MRVRALIATVAILGVAAQLAMVQPMVADAATTVSGISAFPAGITRLSGADRYGTAVAASRRYAPNVPVAIVATGTDFPDALSAASAAAALGGPLLLTQPTKLPSSTSTELKRLKPKKIYVVGGTGVVSAAIAKELGRIAPVKRLAGADRYATGDAIAKAVFPHADHAIIATGKGFADALAATGAAGSRRAPIMLVDGSKKTVSKTTLSRLSALGVRTISIVGGTAAVTSAIQSQLTKAGFGVKRYGGADRYATAALINAAYFAPGSSVNEFFATGLDFPDALAAGALAGRLAAPLELTLRTCVDPAVNDSVNALGANNRVVMGGVAVLSSAASQNARCVYPVTSEPLSGWATSGFTLSTDAPEPYSDRPPVNVNDASIKLDKTGLLIYTRADNHKRADHPVAYAQYGISALLEYQRTSDKIWLDRAVRQAQQLITMHTVRGNAWWYPYNFPWTYDAHRVLKAPWWSGMAQGQALSLFVRLAEQTGDAKWDTAADHTWLSFTQSHSSTAAWTSLNIDNHLYFEEYAGNQKPLLVMNGHIFAIFGLYDYWRHTGDAKVAQYIDGAATTVLERMLPLVRVPGGVSYYCVQADYCQTPRWQNTKYHGIHSWQFDTLASITADDQFSTWAQTLRSDWGAPKTFSRMAVGPSPLPLGPSDDPMSGDLGTW